jgi:hypothetical protein
LNNDGRADYLHLDTDGSVTAYLNLRGHGSGLGPTWIPAGVIASGVGTSRDNITFGDLNGDGRMDYIFVDTKSGALQVWLNQCTGDRFQVGDATFFADIDGDGRDDYLSISENGAIEAYTNGGWDALDHKWL